MECVILAGGFGTRLRPVTYNMPKPLIPLVNKPMIMHIIQALPREITKVILPVNYKKEMLTRYFEENSDNIEPEVILVEEREPLGTGGAIKNCENEISSSFLVYNGDVINSIEPSDIIDFHRKQGGIGTLAVWEVFDPSRYGIIGFDREKRIEKFLEKPKEEEIFSNYINAGNYVLEPEILDHIKSNEKVSIEREVYPFVLEKGLYAFPFSGYWIDSGTRVDFLNASKIIMRAKNVSKRIGGGTFVHPETKLFSPVQIGSNCKIDNSIIGQSVVIGNNCRVKKNVRIINSTILNNVNLEKNSVIKNSIVGMNFTVKEKNVIENTIIANKNE